MKPFIKTILISIFFIFVISIQNVNSQSAFTPKDLLELKSVSISQLSSDGSELIYSISTPRGPNEAAGGSHRTYYKMDIDSRESQPLFEEGVNASSPQWSPDGTMIGFLLSTEGITQVWAMPLLGGDMLQLSWSETGINNFKWNPATGGLAYLSRDAVSEKEKELKKRGYGFIFYEENLKNNNLSVLEFDPDGKPLEAKQLTSGVNVWNFEFNQQGTHIAATISPKNLIDQSYMFRKIYLIDIATVESRIVSDNEGKLGNYAFSPNGKYLSYTAGVNINDPAVSQLYINHLEDNYVSNLTPEDFKGHISWANWKDDNEVIFLSGEGVYPKLTTIAVSGGARKIILDAKAEGIIYRSPQYSSNFNHFVFTGSTTKDRSNIYYWDGKSALIQITDINPGLKTKTLAKQELFRFTARDGMEIEGLLMYPLSYIADQKYPLIVYVHGGPESHHSNGWLSSYSTPGQVMANKGYLVAYFNYRASTGYGVDFSMEGFMDPAGAEFDDLADGIEYLIEEKGADRERVGMAGGSYGGYASGWFATYYTRYVRAVCDFVGISNVISKKGTTDIPYEELYVHSGDKLENQWQMNLERSPVYWAHQSKTATLIYGGANDPRVHPSQSMELYRRMKMNDHPAVRLVQYPGEGHGNRKQVGQIDVLYRQIEWLDWYVRDLKPLDGPMPRLDISDRYGLDW